MTVSYSKQLLSFFVVGLLFEGGEGEVVFLGGGNIKGEERFILEQNNTVLGTL